MRQNVNIEWEVGEGGAGGWGGPRVCRETEREHKVVTGSPTVV